MGTPEDVAAEKYFTPPEILKVEDFDECECGDYRVEHKQGIGPCKVCRWNNPIPESKPCQEFRLFSKAKEIPEVFRICSLCGMPSEDGKEHPFCMDREQFLADQAVIIYNSGR